MKVNFDPARYTSSAPLISVESGIVLARALVKAMPQGMPAIVGRAAAKLGRIADKAQEALAIRQRIENAISPEDRNLDLETDANWSALRLRLQGAARLQNGRHPRAARADELLTLLFGNDGLSFLAERFTLQYAAMDTLLKRIDQENLAADIDALAGPEYLAEIRAIHIRYGEMVQRRYRNDGDAPSLIPERSALRQGILDYATKVVGTVDEEDPQTLVLAREALAPLDVYREQNRRPGSGGGGGSTAGGGEPSPAR